MDEDQNNVNRPSSEQVANTSKVAYDPGWNDPPKVSFGGAMGQTKFIKKGLLNKRVAFPLHANSPPASSTSCQSATPPKGDCLFPFSSGDSPTSVASKSSVRSPVITPATSVATDPMSPSVLISTQPIVESKTGEDHQESGLEKVMSIFEVAISELVTPENADKIEVDIRKRLEAMKKMWSEDKLSKPVTQKMVQLAEALQKGEGSVANDIHIEIIVDHTSQVNTWMPGVRKLVHLSMLASREAQKTLDIESDLEAKKDLQQDTVEEKASSTSL